MRKILLITGLIIIIGLSVLYLINGLERDYYYQSKKLLGVNIPRSVKILDAYDTHGGFHGDGQYYVVFQFNKAQFDPFLKKVFDSKLWKEMPLPNDIQKISYWFTTGEKERKYEIPITQENAIYYFHDFQKNKKPLDERYSVNSILVVLDFKTYRLFICRSDS